MKNEETEEIKCTSNLYCILCIIYSYIRCIEIHDMHVLLICFKRRVRKKKHQVFSTGRSFIRFFRQNQKKNWGYIENTYRFFQKDLPAIFPVWTLVIRCLIKISKWNEFDDKLTYFSMTMASLPGPAEKRPNAFGRLGWPKRVSMRTSARVAASVCFSRHTTLAAASRPVFRSRHAITTARDPRSSSSSIS